MQEGIILLIAAIAAALLFAGVWLGTHFFHQPCPWWLWWLMEIPWVQWLAGSGEIISRAGIEPGMKVLDVGCGAGRIAIPAARQVGSGGSVTALDIQQQMLDRARKRAAREGLENVCYVRSGPAEAGLPEGEFDRALMVAVIHEIRDKKAALRAVYDSLRPGGIMSVTEIRPDPDALTANAIRGLAAQAGFEFIGEAGPLLALTLNFQKPPAP